MASELTYDIVEGEKWSPKLFCILWDWNCYFSELLLWKLKMCRFWLDGLRVLLLCLCNTVWSQCDILNEPILLSVAIGNCYQDITHHDVLHCANYINYLVYGRLTLCSPGLRVCMMLWTKKEKKKNILKTYFHCWLNTCPCNQARRAWSEHVALVRAVFKRFGGWCFFLCFYIFKKTDILGSGLVCCFSSQAANIHMSDKKD